MPQREDRVARLGEGTVLMSSGDAVAPPSGAVSFLFTDVEGSTRRWEQQPDQMRVALEAHDAILRASIADGGGFVFSTAGDAFAAAFQSPADAVEAASAAQRGLAAAEWPGDDELRVRMGVHTGEAQQRDDDYFGPTLNRAARLMSAAHGGQTVVSAATRSLLDGAKVIDLGEHRLKDLSEPEHVWQLLVEGLTTEFPALRTLDAVPGNLPTDPATFIGREGDIERLMGALESHRVVTVTGVGGVGKTRLSLQVAADASHHYPGGIWFVELASVRVDDAVPFQFLETLGLDSVPGQQPVDTVAASLGDGAVLLVIDNCEHVLSAAAGVIGGLVSACPNLKVLASSRRALGAGGEQVQPVQPLDTSDVYGPATRLFLERAASVRGDDDLVDRAELITEICARLDGVPLAIELAAARTRSMTPDDLLGRLDERFRLLKGSRASEGEERHKTLLSTIEWSHDLLDDDQKLLFARLGVFAGSFTFDAAERVCSDDDLDEFDIVDLIDELVDHSLVIADTRGESARFRILETIREFAVRKLGEELMDLRDRHATYHAEWAERIGVGLYNRDEQMAVAELEAGWSDLRAAVVHATGDLELMAQIFEPLAADAYLRRRLEPGEWAAAALSVADLHGASDHARAVFLCCAVIGRVNAADPVQADALGSRLVEHCESTQTPMPLASGAIAPAALTATGNIELASRLQALVEVTAADATEHWVPALMAVNRAVIATYSGLPEVAERESRAAVEHSSEDLSPSLLSIVGWMAAANIDAPEAEVIAIMEHAVEQASLVNSQAVQPLLVQFLSSLRAERGDSLDQAMIDAADNLDQQLASKNLSLITGAVRRAALMLIKVGDHDVAARLLGWVDRGPANPISNNLAAEVELRVPQMRDALGTAWQDAAQAGALLTTEAVIRLASTSLRAAAAQLDPHLAHPESEHHE